MSSVVLAIAVIGIGSSLTTTVQQSAVVEQDETSALLARQLMEEIAAKPFLDPDTGTVSSRESSRSLYDNVDDYNGYTDTIDASHPASSLQGKTVAVTNGRKYTRTVSITYHATPNGPNVPSGDFALILVAVTSPSGHVTQLWRMATNTTLIQK